MSTAFSESGWADRDQDNFLFLGWETLLESSWTTSWPKAWGCGKETEILPHYYFPWKDLIILHKKIRGQMNTIVMEHFKPFSSISPNLPTSSIPINQSINQMLLSNPITSEMFLVLPYGPAVWLTCNFVTYWPKRSKLHSWFCLDIFLYGKLYHDTYRLIFLSFILFLSSNVFGIGPVLCW